LIGAKTVLVADAPVLVEIRDGTAGKINTGPERLDWRSSSSHKEFAAIRTEVRLIDRRNVEHSDTERAAKGEAFARTKFADDDRGLTMTAFVSVGCVVDVGEALSIRRPGGQKEAGLGAVPGDSHPNEVIAIDVDRPE
jgi:hypothetical protein